MLKQNPFSGDRRRMEQAAQRMAETAADRGTETSSPNNARRAGTFAADGTWQPYGRLGMTGLGAGFKVRGD